MSLAPITAHLIAAEFGATATPQRRSIAAAVLSVAVPTPHPTNPAALWLTVPVAVNDRPAQIPLDRMFMLLRDGDTHVADEGQVSVTVDHIVYRVALASTTTFSVNDKGAAADAYGLSAHMACEICARPFGSAKVRRRTPGGPFVHVSCLQSGPTR